MSTERIISTWTIKHGWRCSICSCVNKGEKDNCTNCGKPIDDNDPEILPDDMSEANKVTDTKLLERFKAGRDLICAYCSTRQTCVRRNCEQCGADLAETTKKAKAKIESTHTANDATKMRESRPNYDFSESKLSSNINIGSARLPEFVAPQKESFWEEWRVVIGVTVVIIAIMVFCFWLFADHDAHVKVASVRWTYDVTLLERHTYTGHGWKNHDSRPDYAQDVSCQTHQVWGHVACNPYQCNPHQEGYNCNSHNCRPHSVRVPNGSHQESRTRSTTCYRPGRPSCSTRNVCTSNGNRSSNCRQVERCVSTTDSYSCQERYSERVQDYRNETQYDTCYETCYRTVYDTCYHQCPVYDDLCEYTYPKWEQIGLQHTEGNDHTIVRPNLNAIGRQACFNTANNELLHTRNGLSQCTRDIQNFYVTFADANHHRVQPHSEADFNRYQVGKTWLVLTNHAGRFEPTREEQ